MSIPSVNIVVQDNALGVLPASTDNVGLSIGACSAGTVNTVYGFGTKEAVRSTLGSGPLVEELCLRLDASGGTQYGVRATGSVAGAVGSVTASGAGPAVTVTGTALDDYQLIVKIVTGGAVGTSTFQVSLDGGDTYSATTATSASYALNAASASGQDTGLTLAFAAGTYVAADTYSATATAPYYSTSELGAAFDAALADARDWSFVHVVGTPASVAGAASVAAAVQVKLDAAATAYRYARAIISVPTDTDGNIITAFAGVTAPRVTAVVGAVELTSVISGRVYKRPASWPVAARVGKVPISEDLGRFASGGVEGVTLLYRDERATPGLADQRFTTLRTFAGGISGFYVTDGRLLSGSTSDFKYWQHGRVIDKACSTAYRALLAFLNGTVRVNATGTIDEGDARAIETIVEGQLNAALTQPGHVSAIDVQVNRTDNILSTSNLRVDVRVVPLGYQKTITATIGFRNPALVVQAA